MLLGLGALAFGAYGWAAAVQDRAARDSDERSARSSFAGLVGGAYIVFCGMPLLLAGVVEPESSLCGQTSHVPLHFLDALDATTERFRDHLAAVADDAWKMSTPCPDWDVHYLVAHVVGGNRFACAVLDGQTSEEAMAAVLGAPRLGDHPLADFERTASAQRERFRRSGSLEREVDHPLGRLSGERFLGLRLFDVAVHAWDLATAIGRDGDLGPVLAETVVEIVEHEQPGMGFGITASGDPAAQRSVMDRLLVLSGRRPASASTLVMSAVLRFNEAISAGDTEALQRLMSKDHVFVDSAGNLIQGREACVDAWGSFFATFPGYQNVFDRIEEVEEVEGVVVASGRSECGDQESLVLRCGGR